MYTPTSMVALTPRLIRQVQLRLQQHTFLLRLLAVSNLVVGGWYLSWRITASMQGSSLGLGIPLLLAELYSYGGGLLFLFNLWQPLAVRGDQGLPAEIPRVDVVVLSDSTDSASLTSLEQTLRATLGLDYPPLQLGVYLFSQKDTDSALVALTQRLGTEDAQTPIMQELAEKRRQAQQQQREILTRLNAQQQELKFLLPAIAEAESFLSSFSYTTTTHLEAFNELLGWFDHLKPDDVPMRTWLECQTALSEAFTNAVEHAHRHQPPSTPIEVEVAFLGNTIQLRVYDYGVRFDFQQALADLPTDLDTMAERGRGLSILQQLGDYLAYTPLGDGRNCFVFLKSYSPIDQAQGEAQLLKCYLSSLGQAWRLLHPQTSISNRLVLQQESLARECQRQEEEKAFSRCRLLTADQGEQLTGEFLLLLKGDEILKPQFLQRVLPYFYDSAGQEVGFVQTRQAGDSFWLDADYPQDVRGVNPGFAVGSKTILRREALTSTGLSLSDLAQHPLQSAVEIHRGGWGSVYHDEILAETGARSEETIHLKVLAQQVQERLRGLFQSRFWNRPELSFGQQLRLLERLYLYGSGGFTLIFLLCPILYYFGGILPVDTYDWGFVNHLIPAYVVHRLSFGVASWGIAGGNLWEAEQNAIALFPIFIQGFFPSRPNSSLTGDYVRLVVPQLLLFSLTLVGLGWSTYQYFTGEMEGAIAYSFNAVWGCYNLLLLSGIFRTIVVRANPEN